MPPRDNIHEIVKQAIIKDGWNITDDPYVISYGVDAFAQRLRQEKRLAVRASVSEGEGIASYL